jgi:hypothetical protein
MADGMIDVDFLRALAAPFRDEQISWRVGSTSEKDGKLSGMALAYIDARDVMDRLDAVCGPAHWQDRYVETEKGRIICTLSIRIQGEWIEKSDGAGDSDVESEKGAISDALKRAAVKWGIGRYLYDLDSPWVECEKRGKSTIMKRSERSKLDKAHANFVRNNFRNAAPSDAGSRETPKSQQATGAAVSPDAAPVQTMGKAAARDDFKVMVEEIRRLTSTMDLKDWGKLNADRVKLQPKDWQGEIRKAYQEQMEGLQHNERAAAEAEEAFEDAR